MTCFTDLKTQINGAICVIASIVIIGCDDKISMK